ncbi:glycosyltransferase [Terrarubrum flagellatum]|uniref:glycosyltransferase n=1 Tax=Terrirubrum flagellatum TaxID=2895980 RepID=UPI0031456A59
MPTLDVLFVHNNFPAQFGNLARFLAGQKNVRVRAISMRGSGAIARVETQRYNVMSGDKTTHAFARRFDHECRRAEQVIYAASALKMQGFDPALIYVHPGWGEALPLRSLFPKATLIVYAEFYYRARGADVGFDPEFEQFGVDGETRVALRNASTLLALADADSAMAPTQWQRNMFPPEFQSKIRVVHDGVDTDALKPDDEALLGSSSEIVTYVARNLEPYRGFHSFMRALPYVLKARPNAHVHIVGGDQVSYGNPPRNHGNWREAMLAEVGSRLDLSRVHFTGSLAYDAYLALLRRSRVHVYLTYPFVLSWSLLEAMALGLPIVGSDTPPVREVIEDGVNGVLAPFSEPTAIAERIIEALAQPARFVKHRHAARRTIVERYDLNRVVLPAQREWIEERLGRAFESEAAERQSPRASANTLAALHA